MDRGQDAFVPLDEDVRRIFMELEEVRLYLLGANLMQNFYRVQS